MTKVLRLLAILVLAAALVPDLRRHAAERMLYRATALLASGFSGNLPGVDPRRLASASSELAAATARALPFDPRPPLVQGVARLALGDAAGAEECLRASIERAEKPEALLHLGRALLVEGRPEDARAVFRRAAWLHRIALLSLPASFRDEALAEAEELRRRIRKGEPAEIPDVPSSHPSPGRFD